MRRKSRIWLSLLVAASGLWVLSLTWPELGLDPGSFPPAMRRAWTERLQVLGLHIYSSLAALFLGAALLHPRLHPNGFHRHLGLAYAALAVVASLSGIVLAGAAFGGTVARLGFAAQGAAWLACTVNGLLAWRRRDWAGHGGWMCSGLMVAMGAVFFRLMTRVGPLWLSLDPTFTYQLSAWLGWLPGLLLSRRLFARRTSTPRLTHKESTERKHSCSINVVTT